MAEVKKNESKNSEGFGFKNAPLGFDKNEVNLYINKLKNQIKEMEQSYEEKLKEAKAGAAKPAAPVPAAEVTPELKEEITTQIRAEYESKVLELRKLVLDERRNVARLDKDCAKAQISEKKVREEYDSLRDKYLQLKKEGASSKKYVEKGEAIISEAYSKAEEIIAQAKKYAEDVAKSVESGKKTAADKIAAVKKSLDGANAELKKAVASLDGVFDGAVAGVAKAETDALGIESLDVSKINIEVPADIAEKKIQLDPVEDDEEFEDDGDIISTLEAVAPEEDDDEEIIIDEEIVLESEKAEEEAKAKAEAEAKAKAEAEAKAKAEAEAKAKAEAEAKAKAEADAKAKAEAEAKAKAEAEAKSKAKADDDMSILFADDAAEETADEPESATAEFDEFLVTETNGNDDMQSDIEVTEISDIIDKGDNLGNELYEMMLDPNDSGSDLSEMLGIDENSVTGKPEEKPVMSEEFELTPITPDKYDNSNKKSAGLNKKQTGNDFDEFANLLAGGDAPAPKKEKPSSIAKMKREADEDSLWDFGSDGNGEGDDMTSDNDDLSDLLV